MKPIITKIICTSDGISITLNQIYYTTNYSTRYDMGGKLDGFIPIYKDKCTNRKEEEIHYIGWFPKNKFIPHSQILRDKLIDEILS